MAKEEQIMGTGNTDADEAMLNMLQRYEVLMMDDLIIGRPDFSYAKLFLAIDWLSRKNVITLYRIGLSCQIRPMNQEWALGQGHQHEELVAQY
jgi:hypothetical protein